MEGTLKKNEYLDLLGRASDMIAEAKRTGVDEKQLAELFGIYYNAFAGAVRSKALYRKKMDADGYPKFVIITGNAQYTCRDAALKDIFKDEYDALTRYPYEDTSRSYVRPYDRSEVIETEEQRPESQTGTNSQMIKPEDHELTKKELKKLKADAKDFKYDPDYDHYYSDVLPEVLKELKWTNITAYIRLTCIVLAAAGVITSLIFL